MAEQGVAVERHLGIENTQTAVFHDDQRIDLEQAHVLLGEGLVEDREKRLAVGSGFTCEAVCVIDLGGIFCSHAFFRINRNGDDLFRRVMRDAFDIHPTFSGNNESRASGGAIDQDRQVELALNVGAVLDVKTVYLLAGRAGLLVTSVLPSISFALATTSSTDLERRTPPFASGPVP